MVMSARILMESRMQDALEGDPRACFDLGVAHSCGVVATVNLIEAHKWFDLAMLGGYAPAGQCRAQVAQGMSPRDLAEARRRSRSLEMSPVRRMARLSATLFA